MKRLLYGTLCLLIMSQAAVADERKDVEAMLKDKMDAVLTVLKNETLEQQEKAKITTEIIEPMFDFQLMAKLALGKQHWYEIPKEKQKRFSELFVKLLKDSYLEKLTLYTDETISFQKPVLSGKRIQIPTVLISKENSISMLYKFYKSQKSWKIYDLEIEGVSLIKSYRTQFQHELSTGTIDDLIQTMEKPKKE